MLNDLKLTRRKVFAVGSAFAATAILAACGEADEDPDGNGNGQSGPTPTAAPDPTPTQQPANTVFATDGEEPVFRIEHEDGFLAVEDIIRRTPIISLYPDGSLIYPGPMIEIFPQPAAPNLLVTKLSDLGMQAISEQLLASGFLELGGRDLEPDGPPIADAPTTVFTVRLTDDVELRVSANALEIGAGLPGEPGETSEERQALADLLRYVTGAPMDFPADHIAEEERTYVPERLEIITYPWNEAPFDFEVEPEALMWPLEEGPSTIGEDFILPGHDARCAVLEGSELDAMLAALVEASIASRWEHLGESSFLTNKPLLPGDEGCVSPFSEPVDPPSGAEISHPDGENDLVLRYELTGGFVPLEWLVTEMPLHSLYGDGTVISKGTQITIFPPPALPALALDRLTPEGIQMLLAEADASGLLQGEQEWHDLNSFIADAGFGVLTINASGETHRVSVYAPGTLDIGDLVSPEEVEFRDTFDRFVAKLGNLRGWLPEDVFLDVTEEYPADRLQIVSQPADSRPFDDAVDSEIDWPLDTPLSELGEPFSLLEMARCFVLEGREFADVMSLLNDANTQTQWISEEEAFVLLVRPLLRDEEGCQHPFE